MKKILTLCAAFVLMTNSFATFNAEIPTKKASEIYLTLDASGNQVSLLELSRMSPKEYQRLSGQRMTLANKLAFKLTQRELKKLINNDGTLNVKKLEAVAKKAKAAADNKRNLRLALILGGIAIALSIVGYFVPFMWILASLAWLAAVIFFIIWLVNMAK